MTRIKKCEKFVLVAVNCIKCGQMTPASSLTKEYCDECYREIRNKESKIRYNKFIRKEFPPKYCVDCNELLPKDKWIRHNVKRCEKCQSEYRKKRERIYQNMDYVKKMVSKNKAERYRRLVEKKSIPKYCIDCGELLIKKHWHHKNIKRCRSCQNRYDNLSKKVKGFGNPVIVGVKCLKCGDIILSKYTMRLYCTSCNRERGRKRIKEKLSKVPNKDKYKVAKEFQKKINYNNKKEMIGTYDTSSERGKVEIIKRDSEGKPDWDSEIKHVQRIKKKTFSHKKYLDTENCNITEGDYLRGDYSEKDK